jgi:hypothetical protein
MAFKFALGAIAAIFCATSVNAETLECKMTVNASSGGYVTELYYFDSDPETGKALVHDGLTEHYEGGPVAAKIVDDSDKKKVFSWAVQMTNSSGQSTKMTFRAAYIKSKKSITITATVGSGYEGSFQGRGTCKEV